MIRSTSDAAQELLDRYVADGSVPGGVILMGRENPVTVVAGVAAIGGPLLRGDEIFRIQSMTKVITTVAALRLVEAGIIGLDDSVEPWLPELANRRVLVSADAELSDTVPATGPITLRHLLTNASGYGAVMVDSPLQRAMTANGTSGGAGPPSMDANEWLRRLTELPLAFHPGQGWRYHHSFGLLGILASRISGQPLGNFLKQDLFQPLGMVDTGFRVSATAVHRLPAAYRHEGDGFVALEAAGGGFHAAESPFDVSHEEVVSTAADFHRFLSLLTHDGVAGGHRLLSPEHVRMMTTDQVPDASKTLDSFFPGFWDAVGWGFGVAVNVEPHRGRYGWSGGLGTDFYVDPDGTIAILLTQVELDEGVTALMEEFQQLS